MQGRQLSVKGLLDTGAVVSVMPVKTYTDKHQVGSGQSGSDLCDWTNPDYFTAARRKTSLDELPSSGEFGRIQSVHLRKRFRSQL